MSHDNNDRNLLVIKASAGSGKTYRLALEYIRHLLFTPSEDGSSMVPRRSPGDKRLLNAHRQLLAITFTNKATDEMKKRIVDELYCLSQPGIKSDYLAPFMQESGLDEAAVRTLARLALNELLFDYSNFNVSTIDSFFQTILRNFARELDRDFNYDIQIDEKYAVRVAVHNFLLALGREGMPSQVDEWVKDYQRHLLCEGSKDKKWKIFDEGSQLNTFADVINTEVFRSAMSEIRDYLGHEDEKGDFVSDFSRIREFQQQVHDVITRLESEEAPLLQELKDALQPMKSALKGRTALLKFLDTGELSSDTLENATDDSKVAGQFLSKQMPDSGFITQIYDLVSRYFGNKKKKDFMTYIEDNLGLLGLLAMIDVFLERFRHESNSILIGDTNDLIGVVLKSGSDFVYERVGTTIAHYMIDEFQDTSTKQYENFGGLIRESLANRNFNMLIGDAKQSIYRFRNADPTVFREKVGTDFAADITDGLSASQRPVDGQPRSTNYRSSRHVVEFNNSLFAFIRQQYADYDTVQLSYEDVEQALMPGIDEKRVPGYVRVLTRNYKGLLDDEVIKGAMLPGETVPLDKDVDVLTVLPGYLLRLHERFDWGKMGILVNTHNQGNKIVERILAYNQQTTGERINIISGESLLLNNSPIIRRIIAMLRFIDISQFTAGEEQEADEPQEDTVARRIQARRLSDQRLYTSLNAFIKAVSMNPDGGPLDNGQLLVQSMSEALSEGQNDVQQSYDEVLGQLLPSAGELTTLVSIVENIIAHFKRDSSAVADVDRETAFLLAFQDTVMQFATLRNGGSVREFLKYWDEKKDKLAVSSSDSGDAINIMTIHAAKGLEFDCVVIPYANWEIDDNSQERSYWITRDAFADAVSSLAGDGMFDSGVIPPLVYVKKSDMVELDKRGLFQGAAHVFLLKNKADVLIDNLNKTYVAMTRPRTELHVFCRVDREPSSNSHRSGTTPSIPTLTPLLTSYAEQVMAPISGAGGEPTGWFERGSLSTRDEIDAKRSTAVATALQVPLDQYTVSDIPVQLSVRVDHASSSSIKAGLRLHGLLSKVHNRNDLDRVIAQGIKHGVVTDDPADPCGIQSIEAHVRRPVMDPSTRIAAWFDPANKVYSERTITSASASLWDEDGIENLRPDRIVRRPDGQILVIDYKSGQRDDRRYTRQLQQYIDKLRAVFPDADIAGRIWYVTLDLIIDHNGKELKTTLTT